MSRRWRRKETPEELVQRLTSPKMVAVYGTYYGKAPVYQRYWIRRKDGIKQRYWKRTKATRRVAITGRYEFHGKGRDLYKAVITAHYYVPIERFQIISAREFAMYPHKYGKAGNWIEKEVDS